jgi:hypothetical protein
MKSKTVILLSLLAPSLLAQDAPGGDGTLTATTSALQTLATNTLGVWRTGARTASSTEHLLTRLVTNAAAHEVTLKTNRYVSVSSGENYLDPSGVWQPSQDLIELMPDGSAAALHGPCKARFSPNLNTSGALAFTSKSNRVFSTHLLCLAWYSPVTGQRATICQIRDCSAELVPPNQIVWRGAFPIADVRVTYTKAAFETDVILTRQPLPCDSFGITNSDNIRLEVWHEYLSPPTPQVKSHVLQSATDPAGRAAMVEPDLVDNTLDFGDFWYPLGRIYSTDELAAATTNTAPAKIELANPARNPSHIPVAKKWAHSPDGSRTYLIESVPLVSIAPMLARLPASGQGASRTKPSRLVASRSFQPPVLKKKIARRTNHPIQIASAAYQPRGCCIDYQTVNNGGDYEFQSGVTYYVAYAYLGGTVTFDPGCVIKGNGNAVLCYGSMVCNGDGGSPSVFTCTSDDAYGESLDPGDPTYNTHIPSPVGTALWAYYNNPSLTGLKFRFAGLALDWDGYSGSLSDTAFEACDTALDGSATASCPDCVITFSGVTLCGVNTPIHTSSFLPDGMTDICSGQYDNGMSYNWEMLNFGYIGVDPNGDPDGDGLTNFQEYTLGTNPNKAATPDTSGAIGLQIFTPLK